MSSIPDTGARFADGRYDLDLDADVLVVGGSLAGVWAALAAAEAGARVVLAEKGWTGTAGVVAAAGVGGSYIVPGDAEQRAGVLAERHDEAVELDDPDYLERVYHRAYLSFQRMREWGYASPRIGSFDVDSMAFLRKRLHHAGVRLLDHSPALELLLDADGRVAGAAGVRRQENETWRVRAGAVILATGGTAYLSGAQGTNGNTGEGHLMAAEAGAGLVGMEFASSYAFVPAGSTTTKMGMYFQGHAYDKQGRRLDPVLPSWFALPNVARTLSAGGTPYYVLDKVPAERRAGALQGVPNFYQYFERKGIDPFSEFWRISLILEGSVRASGGIAINDDCSTSVPGLYAAGDVTDKSRLVGAFLGGAGPCIAWCVVSGEWAGQGAAAFARALGPHAAARALRASGGIGLRPARARRATPPVRALVRAIQDEVIPLEKNYYRNAATMQASLAALDAVWHDLQADAAAGSARDTLKLREVAGLAIAGRWSYAAALARTESRGLHQRTDRPDTDPAQRHHLHIDGLDRIQVRARATPAAR